MSAGKRRRFVYLDTSSWNKLFDSTQAHAKLHQELREHLGKRRAALYSSDEVGEELVLGLHGDPIRMAAICRLLNGFCGSHVIKPVWELVAQEFSSKRRDATCPYFLRNAAGARRFTEKLKIAGEQTALARRQIRPGVDHVRAEKRSARSSTRKANARARKKFHTLDRPRDFAQFLSLCLSDLSFLQCFYAIFQDRISIKRPDFSLDFGLPIRTSPSLSYFVRYLLWNVWAATYEKPKRNAHLGDRADHHHFVYACHADWFVTDDGYLRRAWDEAGRRSTTVMNLQTFLNRVGLSVAT